MMPLDPAAPQAAEGGKPCGSKAPIGWETCARQKGHAEEDCQSLDGLSRWVMPTPDIDLWNPGDVSLVDDHQAVDLQLVDGLLRRVLVCCDCGLVHLMSVDIGTRRAYFVREDGPKGEEIRAAGRAAGHVFQVAADRDRLQARVQECEAEHPLEPFWPDLLAAAREVVRTFEGRNRPGWAPGSMRTAVAALRQALAASPSGAAAWDHDFMPCEGRNHCRVCHDGKHRPSPAESAAIQKAVQAEREAIAKWHEGMAEDLQRVSDAIFKAKPAEGAFKHGLVQEHRLSARAIRARGRAKPEEGRS